MNPLLLSVLLLLIAGQGLFLSVAIQLLPKRNKKANSILSLILLIVTLMLLGRVAISYYYFPGFWRIGTIVELILFIFGPLVYCYVRRLLFTESKLFQLRKVHYIPSALYVLYIVWTFTLSSAQYVEWYRQGKFDEFYKWLEFAGIISSSFYVVKSFLLLRVHSKYEKEQYASQSQVANYLNVLLTALSVFCVLWIFSFVNRNFLPNLNPYINYNIMWISVGGFMFIVGFYCLKQPEILRVYKPKEKQALSNRLNAQEVVLLKEKLDKKLQEEQLFLNSSISLNSLAHTIGTTANNLSWLLNNVYHKTFYQLINEYRINAFLKLIEQDKHKKNTLFVLAMDVGFNSKSTFNKAFKSIMNQTPSNYIKQLKDQA
jgi:AraC-like DNA-binding protein